MLRHDRSAPIWLFSFVDLAFLLLIAFTQIGPRVDAIDPALGQIEIPQLAEIESPVSQLERSKLAPLWQLRVYPIAPGDSNAGARAPFELIEPGSEARVASEQRADPKASNSPRKARPIDATELASQLRLLRDRELEKPILAPHRDSRSEDLLIAVGLLQEVWQTNRAVAVVPGRRAVTSGPRGGIPERP